MGRDLEMTKSGVLQRFFLMIAIVFGGVSVGEAFGAYASQLIQVNASGVLAETGVRGLFFYSPESGQLFMRGENEVMTELAAFGKIRNLNTSELEILAADFAKDTQAGPDKLVVIRHGNWVSIIDPAADKPVAANIGPVQEARVGKQFSAILRRDDGTFVVLFRGKATLVGNEGEQSLLFVYNSKNETLGWIKIRGDVEPKMARARLISPESIELEYRYPVLTPGTNVLRAPESKAIIDLKAGTITRLAGSDLATATLLEDADSEGKPFGGMYMVEAAHEFISVSSVPHELLASGNPNDLKARNAAIAIARLAVDKQRAVDAHIREAMRPILGQEEVIDGLAKFATAQLDGKSHATILFAGPTGVGKTSGFNYFIDGWMKALDLPTDRPVFYMSLADISDVQLLESRLKGATPPYVGADAPSPIVQWVLDHPEGGGLFFDEIEKTKPEVMDKLMSFLEKGELALTPHLVAKMCERLKKVPKVNWPRALREGTDDGKNTQVEIVLKLRKTHIIGLGTNAGNENFGDSGAGKELTSEQDLSQANKRFTDEVVRRELKSRGYKPEVTNRIQKVFAFKKILKKDHVRIVEQRLADVKAKFGAKLVDLELSEAAKKFFEDETYEPSAGARNIERGLESWLTENLNDAMIGRAALNPGDQIVVDVARGDGATVAPRMTLHRKDGGSERLAEYTVGKALPSSPKELLERARARLKATLERRIIGHRKEIALLTDAILTKLAKQVADPRLKGRPIVIYFDGTPGIGKTEIAKAVAEALFEDQSRLTRVDFNEIVDMHTFYKYGIEKMNASIRTNPESQVILWDELHRLKHTPLKQMIENNLMGVIDEGKLPVGPDSKEKIEMPGATIIMATGNLLEEALGEHTKGTNSNRALHADFRLIMRHPERFLDVFSNSFGGAFRSRLGAPLLFAPLTDEEVAILRDRLFEENMALLKAQGITPVLTESGKAFFAEEYIPLEGGRWVRRAMELYVQNALVAMVTGREDEYKDSTMEVRYERETRKLVVDVKKDGKIVQTAQLSEAPRAKSDFHPDVKERTAWKTSAHEAAGHALVEAVLYGADAVAEINTFGGGMGGWVEHNTAAAGRDMYYGTKSGVKELAVLIAGHLAEVKYLGVSANGASSDFDRARSVAQSMLLDGSMPDIAPIAYVRNPKTGEPMFSEEKKRELEKKMQFLLEYSGRIARMVIDKNEALGLEVAKALHSSPDMHMDGKTFENLVKGRLVSLTDAEMEAARYDAVQVVESKPAGCATLLMVKDAVRAGASSEKKSWSRALFQKISGPFLRR